jgi:hypothetical protein
MMRYADCALNGLVIVILAIVAYRAITALIRWTKR